MREIPSSPLRNNLGNRQRISVRYNTHERCCEAALAARLADLLEAGELPELEPLEAHFAPDPQSLPHLDVRLGSPADYNDLLDHPAELATPPGGAA